MKHLLLSLALLTAASAAIAQDTRTVTEPKLPAACTTLDAKLTKAGTTLAPADEQKLDTERIQKAIDTCAKGKAVVLRTSGASNAFLTGPLDLREGITLVVDTGVTLFASRDPAVYEVSPGSLRQGLHHRRPRMQAADLCA